MTGGGTGRSVLVVDDEQGMRDTLAEILTGVGYDVATAKSGDDALVQLSREDFDVVLMDIRMPGRDGIATLKAMGGPPPPVVMMTAYAVEEQLAAANEAKSFAVVQKPVPVPYLIEILARAAAA